VFPTPKKLASMVPVFLKMETVHELPLSHGDVIC
jgi:hypothetical protein